MRIADQNIGSLGELIEKLKVDITDDAPVWFRGHGGSTWQLVPSIGRNPAHIGAELTAIKRFKQDAWSHLASRPTEAWEWMFTMQHYRAKTRLLDWSENPLVAAYFAAADKTAEGIDGAIWALHPITLNRLAGHARAFDKDILAFGADRELESYLPDQVDAKRSLLQPVAAIGPRNSPRMVAQSGTFTIMHAEPTPVESIGDGSHIWRYVIPAAAKPNILRELSLIGVTEYSLFPELDRVAAIAEGLYA